MSRHRQRSAWCLTCSSACERSARFANPIYAGAYVYGVRPTDRRRQKAGRPSTDRRVLRAQKAAVFLPDRVPAYITWDRYQRIQIQLRSNRAAWGGAPRAGSALHLRRDQLRSLRGTHDGRSAKINPALGWKSHLPMSDHGFHKSPPRYINKTSVRPRRVNTI
jgi:hypothetical protein